MVSNRALKFEKFSNMDADFRRCAIDHSIFIRKIKDGCVILAIYVDDILLIGSDTAGIAKMKIYLGSHSITKDTGWPRYFLGIVFAYQKNELVLSQKMYALNLLQEACLLRCKPESIPIVLNPKSRFFG